jgi:hypothetical protein
MNAMSKPTSKPCSVFPEGVGDRALWALCRAREQLDDEMKVSSIVSRLMENLSAHAKEPNFNEADYGEIEHVGELIEWLFQEQWGHASKLRAEIAELEKEAQA